jgi:hypothetical protein
MHDK